MKSICIRFLADEAGATAIEYGLIAAIVGVGIIVSLSNLATAISNVDNTVAAAM